MRFGVFLPTYWNDYGDTPIHLAIRETGLAAEALGYEGVWANDIVILPATEGEQVIEPLITLASLVHLGSKLMLGTSVLVLPQRDAIVVAKQAAALDILSQHRLILGVGIGHRPEEFALLSADYAQRAAKTDESIEVMQALWRQPSVSYDGQFHHLDRVSMLPHPHEGGPQIWIGGDTLASVRRAAKYGDGWLPFNWPIDNFRSGVSMLQDLTHDRRAPTIGNVFPMRIVNPSEITPVQFTTSTVEGSWTGDTDTFAQHLDTFDGAGLEYALVGFESENLDDLLRQMSIFAEEVMPRFT